MAMQRAGPGGWGWGLHSLAALWSDALPALSCHCPSETCRSPHRRGPVGLHWRSRCHLDISLFFRKKIRALHCQVSEVYQQVPSSHWSGGSDLKSCFLGSAPDTGRAVGADWGGKGRGDAEPATPGLSGLTHVCTGLRRWRLLSRKMGPDRTLPEASFLGVWLVLVCAGLLASGDLMVCVTHAPVCHGRG